MNVVSSKPKTKKKKKVVAQKVIAKSRSWIDDDDESSTTSSSSGSNVEVSRKMNAVKAKSSRSMQIFESDSHHSDASDQSSAEEFIKKTTSSLSSKKSVKKPNQVKKSCPPAIYSSTSDDDVRDMESEDDREKKFVAKNKTAPKMAASVKSQKYGLSKQMERASGKENLAKFKITSSSSSSSSSSSFSSDEEDDIVMNSQLMSSSTPLKPIEKGSSNLSNKTAASLSMPPTAQKILDSNIKTTNEKEGRKRNFSGAFGLLDYAQSSVGKSLFDEDSCDVDERKSPVIDRTTSKEEEWMKSEVDMDSIFLTKEKEPSKYSYSMFESSDEEYGKCSEKRLKLDEHEESIGKIFKLIKDSRNIGSFDDDDFNSKKHLVVDSSDFEQVGVNELKTEKTEIREFEKFSSTTSDNIFEKMVERKPPLKVVKELKEICENADEEKIKVMTPLKQSSILSEKTKKMKKDQELNVENNEGNQELLKVKQNVNSNEDITKSASEFMDAILVKDVVKTELVEPFTGRQDSATVEITEPTESNLEDAQNELTAAIENLIEKELDLIDLKVAHIQDVELMIVEVADEFETKNPAVTASVTTMLYHRCDQKDQKLAEMPDSKTCSPPIPLEPFVWVQPVVVVETPEPPEVALSDKDSTSAADNDPHNNN